MTFLPFLSGKYLKLFLVIVLSLFCTSASLYSQVRIKEKVGINPTQTKLSFQKKLSTLSAHSVRVQVSMSSNIFCYTRFDWWEQKYITYCGPGIGTARIIPPAPLIEVDLIGAGGEATFDIGGTYYYIISWVSPEGTGSSGQSANIKVYLDDTLIDSRSVENASSTWGHFIVAFPRCGPECTTSSPPEPPTFTFSPTTDDKYCGQDFGYTAYDKNEIFNNYQIELCYNSSLDQWITKLNNANKAVFKYYSGICEKKIDDNPNWVKIRNINDINNLPPNDICQAKSDFEATYKYPLRGSKYIYKELIETHEKGHETKIQNLLKNLYNNQNNFGNQFLAFKLNCSQTNDLNDAKKQTETFMKKLVGHFRDKFNSNFTELYGDSESKRKDLYDKWYNDEKKTQIDAYNKIWDKYKKYFRKCSK